MSGTRLIRVRGATNREFIAAHARAGRVGLACGVSLSNQVIARAQRHLDRTHRWSRWSHAFLFQGVRADGEHWVIESDLEFHRRHVRVGVQENRAAKYGNDDTCVALAVLDFQLSDEQTQAVLREALDLVANRVRYSIRELLGTLIAMKLTGRRAAENLLARDHAFFCSAMVQHVFRRAGIDLVPGLDVKHTAPEDLARSPLPHTMYLLERDLPRNALERVEVKLRRLKSKLRAKRRPAKKR